MMSSNTTTPAQPYRWFFTAGIAFVLTVGVSWGVWILWQIAAAGRFTGAPIQQVNAHGHAQIFGWVGLFVMGFAYQMFPAIWQRSLVAPKLIRFVFTAMVVGIAARTAGIAGAGTDWAVPVTVAGGVLEIAAIATFLAQLRGTWRQSLSRGEPDTRFIAAGLAFFLLQAIFDLWHSLNLLRAPTREALIWSVATYQAVLRDLQIHGFALLLVFGVSMRVLPRMYGLPQPTRRRASVAWYLIVAGIVGEVVLFVAYRFTGKHVLAAALLGPWLLLASGAFSVTAVFRPWRPFPTSDRSAKFVRTAYLWLIASMIMLLALPIERALVHVPFSHAYYGAIRHAVTVGFISQMIVGMAARVVPTLCRVQAPSVGPLRGTAETPSVSPLRGTAETPSISPIRGTAQTPSLPPLRGTFWLLNTGCLLRVVLQSLTDVHPVFFRLVGISGVVELSALTLWSVHVVDLMRQRTAGGRVQAAMEPVR